MNTTIQVNDSQQLTTDNRPPITHSKIAVIGLGYVGLPLARLFATKYVVVGFDVNTERVAELQSGVDVTLEIENEVLQNVLKTKNSNELGLFCTTNINDIDDCNFYIITVPTPVDKNNRPVLTPLIKASETVGKVLKKKDIVVYESTVYPGATEEDCVPVLEKFSKLSFNKDFYVGYSPERINPGDKKHTVEKILKVTSGSTPEIGVKIDNLYKSVITAGTHLAPTIKVAEAAKVIENSQRDVNIAFVNELAKIFNLMNINTNDVLEAAGTKWNFLPFKPGLVGGHCIGVDPYYLIHKSQEKGYFPQLITTARRINENMSTYVSERILKLMALKQKHIVSAKVLILGMTFKENCPDLRNTRVVEVVEQLQNYHAEIEVYDPWVDPQDAAQLNQPITQNPQEGSYDLVVLAVAHDQFLQSNPRKYLTQEGVLFDLKGLLPEKWVDERL